MRGLRAPLAPLLAGPSLCRPGLRRCWVSRVRGVSWPLTGHPHKAVAQEIEVGAAKHLALEHLKAVDMPLHGAIAPGHGYSRFDSGIGSAQPLRTTLQGRPSAAAVGVSRARGHPASTACDSPVGTAPARAWPTPHRWPGL